MGLGNEGSTLKTSRAYLAGLGTTGVLIGSFFLLLTVGSTLVAFRGVPGAASNGDLSSIELREQREAAQRGAGLLTASTTIGENAGASSAAGAPGDVFGRLASAGRVGAAGQIREDLSGSAGPGTLHPGKPAAPLAEKSPSTVAPAPAPGAGTGVVAVPVDPGALVDQGSSSTGDSGSGTTTDTGSTTTDTGSGASTGGSSGTGSTGTGSTGTGTGTGTAGGATGTVGGTVTDTTGSVGGATGAVAPAVGQTVTEAGSTAGGLIDGATSVVGGLTGSLAAG